MSTEEPVAAAAAAGALLLCRAEPDSVAAVAPLLGERMPLARAGEEWSVLVPEGGPWRHGGEPVDRVLSGWAAALAVGAPWPVLALWWDADRAGYALASGFRRPVGYVWLTDGTPVGEDEAMRTFAARLGLDPVLDVQSLDRLTRPDPGADARARLHGLLAVLTRAGVDLPDGLDAGEPADRLGAVARDLPAARRTEAPRRRPTADETRLAPWMPWVGGPGARALALTQMAAGLPLTAWGLRRHSGGWTAAGALLMAHGAVGTAYGLSRRP
ncbi:Membrane protein [Streptomyces ambofaciens ATCC 23877]|uniref:Membrane protein n=1 Tax=Streptomyces ambofaciens (strain ATCC 23877 / 3486 / DSM 40053 / JCM 4204 / NBRC 12836 / NRRL B-2516) TaxID=278992 RepID=A0A0K2AYA3_STRA7|nr:hypothetical protein [Streptomyces ambofaciens]AKZ58100.1 Membrane protein [Streptomyces ambofaciens ATCC 23877]